MEKKQGNELIENVSKKINKGFFISRYLEFKNNDYSIINEFLVENFDTITMVKTINEMGKLKELMDYIAFSDISDNLREKCFSYDPIDFDNIKDYRSLRYKSIEKQLLIEEIKKVKNRIKKEGFFSSGFKSIVDRYNKLIKIDEKYLKSYQKFVKDAVEYIRFFVYEDLGSRWSIVDFIDICNYISNKTPFKLPESLLDDLKNML